MLKKSLKNAINRGNEIKKKLFDFNDLQHEINSEKEKKGKVRVLLVIYDNGSYIHWFPQGLAHIAGVMEQEDCHIDFYHQDMNHYPDDHLKHYLDTNEKYDIAAVSVIGGYWQYQRLCGLSKSIAETKNRPNLYIIGGYGPTPEPNFFLLKTGADICAMGEGEQTTRELVRAYKSGGDYSKIDGIAIRSGTEIKINKPRKLVPADKIDDRSIVPMPAYHLFPMEYYRLLRMPHADTSDFCIPVLSGRGCTFKCNFCYRMDTGFRARSIDSIIEEIRYLKKNWGISYIAFSDDLLMVSEKRTVDIMEKFIAADLNIKFDCNGRLNYARPEILDLMKEAGCVYINYGIEAYDNQILRNMKKGLTVKMIDEGIAKTRARGITPGLNIIWGNIGENLETLQKGVDFLKSNSDWAEMRTIRPVTPYPGSPLYHHCIKEGLIDKDNPAEDFYERLHLNSDLLAVNLTDVSDDEFHRALLEANSELTKFYFENKIDSYRKQSEELYLNKNKNFRGYRHSS